jgi:hypothetical protein
MWWISWFFRSHYQWKQFLSPDPGVVSGSDNLPHSRPVDTHHCPNLPIAHALLAHFQNPFMQ